MTAAVSSVFRESPTASRTMGPQRITVEAAGRQPSMKGVREALTRRLLNRPFMAVWQPKSCLRGSIIRCRKVMQYSTNRALRVLVPSTPLRMAGRASAMGI